MKLITTTAIALVAAICAVPAAAQYATPSAPPPRMPEAAPTAPAPAATAPAIAKPTVKPSQKAYKALLELQKAVESNDTASIPAKVAAAQAVASTKEDRYLIGQMQLKAALAAKDNAAVASAIDAVAASGYQNSNDIAQLYMALGSTFYAAKQYDQAAAAFQKGAALAPNDTDILLNLGETRIAQGHPTEGIQAFERAIQIKQAAGQKPEEAIYKRALGIAYQAKLPNSVELGRQWVAAYPGPDSWRNAIAVLRNQSQQDTEGTIDLFRLMQASGALSTAGDYTLYAESAAVQQNYNEAQAVVDAGLAANVLNPSDPQARDLIAGLKAKNKATVADLQEAEKSSQNATAFIRIGDRYYGMGQYSKAAELYRKAVGAPGADANIANLHLGMALARAGDKAGAIAALNAVSGPRAEIAKFWLAFVQQHA